MAKNNKPVSEPDTISAAEAETAVVGEEKDTAPATPQPTGKTKYEGVTTFAYVGPSLPGGKLKSNTVLSGTYAEITAYYAEAITLYPGVERLIVPVARLAEAREKTQSSGNVMYKYYTEIAAAINAKGAEK